MSIERKVLITLLLLLLSILFYYLFYTKLYQINSDIEENIEKYNHLISTSKDHSNISEMDISELLQREQQLLTSFFSDKEADISMLTPHIKELLLNSRVEVLQYREGEKSTLYSIKGTTSSLLNFLYALHLEGKYYNISLLTLKMLNNREFQGDIKISRSVLSSTPKVESFTHKLREVISNLPYTTNINSILGTSFNNTVIQEIAQIENIEPIKEKTTDKFNFVGILKKQDKKITMFKEKDNGRVYRFEPGKTISGWKFIGKVNNRYIFEKDYIKYEVTD